MGDDLRNFDREYETFGSSGGPVVDRARRRASVEGRVHLDCRKLSRIVTEKIAWLQAPRIERTFPARCREGRSAEKNSRQRKRAINCEPVCKLACLLQFLHLEECRVANRLHFWTLWAHRSERLHHLWCNRARAYRKLGLLGKSLYRHTDARHFELFCRPKML